MSLAVDLRTHHAGTRRLLPHVMVQAAMRRVARVDRAWLGLAALSGFALALRLAGATQQSAYMDEGTNVLTGRLLIEQHAVYAEVLNWAYGSYLWPLVAGAADLLGGLALVRAVTAVCGVVMVLATTLLAYELSRSGVLAHELSPSDVPTQESSPSDLPAQELSRSGLLAHGLSRSGVPAGTLATSDALASESPPSALSRWGRWGVALLAGGLMALAPTAVAVSRFGTYDALAGASFMLGFALLAPGARTSLWRLPVAALLLFVAFLAKYLVAIYFPFVCAYVVLSGGWNVRLMLRNVLSFALPLAAACGIYLLVFLGPLLTLLTSSLRYSDLKSPDPLREYVWTRPELWLLLVLAVLGGWRASWQARAVAGIGAVVIAGFQVEARPDFDFWKHSIYLIYFLAPLAGLAWLRVPQHTGTWRVVALGAAASLALLAWAPVETAADRLIDFFPNLETVLPATNEYTRNAALVLTDDTALRYYLYPRLSTDQVVGPFAFDYHGQSGPEAYREAIADRFFDAIVLDGGVTPQGNLIRQQLGATIDQAYQRVVTLSDPNGFTEEVFIPDRPAGSTRIDDGGAPWPMAITFDDPSALQTWGAHPDTGDWQAGRQLTTSTDRAWDTHASLRFVPSASASAVSLRREGPVSRVRAHIYLVPADGQAQPGGVHVGFMGFDANWQWRDDGFRWQVPFNAWTTITWDLTTPGEFREIGLKLPPSVGAAFIGSFEIQP